MDSLDQLSIFAARLRRLFSERPQAGKLVWSEEQFDSFAIELFQYQFETNEVYRTWCKALGTEPGQVSSWQEIPALPAAAFKENTVSCLSVAERKHFFESSRTTGRAGSRHYHSEASLEVYADSCWPWFGEHVMPLAPANLVCLTPGPSAVPHSSLVHMFEVIRRRMHASEEAFTGAVANGSDWVLEPERVVRSIESAAEQRKPVCLLGTAFSFVHLIDWLREQNRKIELPQGSRIMETGGYKGKSRVLAPEDLYRDIRAWLGIPFSGIVSEYGMSELSSQAYAQVNPSSGVRHSFAFPPWARCRIIDPESGREVVEGEVGIVRVLDLANVFSVLCLQTEDLGRREGARFTLLGRARYAEPKGCSLMSGTGAG